MQVSNFNKKLLIFIFFNIFYAIFYLHYKHHVGNDTSISEWLINYQGGFTRRGLGGEINILLANYFYQQSYPRRLSRQMCFPTRQFQALLYA